MAVFDIPLSEARLKCLRSLCTWPCCCFARDDAAASCVQTQSVINADGSRYCRHNSSPSPSRLVVDVDWPSLFEYCGDGAAYWGVVDVTSLLHLTKMQLVLGFGGCFESSANSDVFAGAEVAKPEPLFLLQFFVARLQLVWGAGMEVGNSYGVQRGVIRVLGVGWEVLSDSVGLQTAGVNLQFLGRKKPAFCAFGSLSMSLSLSLVAMLQLRFDVSNEERFNFASTLLCRSNGICPIPRGINSL
ncbi:hypothetical protein Nepgr_019628 [Nepenthes gracilis]|uniref:Uncharacterized protein n=1 Tax=Nepenthes gracilis TaxID=150966 RepID=A0AAD3XUA9_NEPGR|nr:hypothetical protein Nepgr_019628 [Nepenthes gracilis]